MNARKRSKIAWPLLGLTVLVLLIVALTGTACVMLGRTFIDSVITHGRNPQLSSGIFAGFFGMLCATFSLVLYQMIKFRIWESGK